MTGCGTPLRDGSAETGVLASGGIVSEVVAGSVPGCLLSGAEATLVEGICGDERSSSSLSFSVTICLLLFRAVDCVLASTIRIVFSSSMIVRLLLETTIVSA